MRRGSPHHHGHTGVDPTLRSTHFGPTLRRFLRQLAPEKWRIISALAATALSVLLSVLAPVVLGKGTDIIFSGVIGRLIAGAASQEEAARSLREAGRDEMATMVESMEVIPGAGIDFEALGRVIVVVIILYASAAFLSWLTSLVLRTAVQNMGWRLRDAIHRKIDVIPLSHVDRHSRGDLISRVSNDVDNATQVMTQTLSQVFQSLLTVVGIIVLMLSLSPSLTGLALLALPAGMILIGFLMSRAQPQFKAQWAATGELSGIVEEATAGREVAALYGLEDTFAHEFNRSNTELYRSSFRAQFVSSLIMPMMSMISSASYVIVAVGGALMVAGGSMSLGQVQALIQYSRQFTHPLGSLASMANLLQSGVASAERVFEFLDAPEMDEDEDEDLLSSSAERVEARERHLSTDTSPADKRGRIVFDHVTFGYSKDVPVIKDLSLTVEPGKMVAIIGPTGAGKTTLVNLLMRFYEIDSGSISIDGTDIRDMTRDELRSRTGIVLQDTWLFDGSIEDNIAFGKAGATHEEVVAAATSSAVDHLVRQLPEGYATHVGDESASLSSGERQLVTIARAFIAEPELLILDEATSSVDTRTELLIQEAMDRLRHGRTAFVIAHRLSTIRHADLILVMDNGSIVEMGTHEELLAAEGVYADLLRASS